MLIGISGYAGSGKDTVGEALRYCIARQTHRIRHDIEFRKDTSYTEAGWEIHKFARALREIVQILTGLPIDYLYTDEFKRNEMSKEWTKRFQTFECDEHNEDGFTDRPLTGREFLQILGTDAIRDNLHPNAWVNALMSKYVSPQVNEDGFIVEQVMDFGTVLWKPNPILDPYMFPNWIITDMRFPNEMEAVRSRGGITVRVNRAKAVPRIHQLHESETALDGAQFDYTIDNNGTLKDLLANLSPIIQKLGYGQQQIHSTKTA